ncbi:MAG: hypothetical protein ACLR1P_11300 [Oscillospiraceae bacterium]
MPVALGLEKITEESPEYLGPENVVTDEMEEVAVVMDKRVPITAAEVAKKCGNRLRARRNCWKSWLCAA